jgi:hypothetical protein
VSPAIDNQTSSTAGLPIGFGLSFLASGVQQFKLSVSEIVALLLRIDARDKTIIVNTNPVIAEEANASEITEEDSQTLKQNLDSEAGPIEAEIVAANRPEIEIPGHLILVLHLVQAPVRTNQKRPIGKALPEVKPEKQCTQATSSQHHQIHRQ